MRILTLLCLIVLSAFGLRELVLILASDETRITWLVEEMQAGWVDGDVGACTDGIALDWIHAGQTDVDHARLVQGLRGKFLRERQERVVRGLEIPAGGLTIAVDGDRATVLCEARFLQVVDGAPRLVWHARLRAELERRDAGWLIVRSEHEDLDGRRPR